MPSKLKNPEILPEALEAIALTCFELGLAESADICRAGAKEILHLRQRGVRREELRATFAQAALPALIPIVHDARGVALERRPQHVATMAVNYADCLLAALGYLE